ncbi:MAG: UDP-2,4-diacetamido-2,4,6-trideoxy-beta-L-altropyranose hydrolase [Magnetococcales bacterium]|nr:UDP-2,4-diacetamido-2,4,6-trideoxy-beta-L-altropyranose hydrolase [Magnetococcales bacterium]
MNVVLRTDASVTIGGGHAMRCLTLAGAMVAQGHRVAFACRAGSREVVPGLAGGACGVMTLPAELPIEAEPQAMAAFWPEGCDLLVVDHYGRDARFETPCRGWAKKILVIDDLADRPHDCDWLLDHTLGRRDSCYAGLTPAGCRMLLGTDHLLLRPAFARHRCATLARRRERRSGRLLVTLGMTDANNVTARVLDGIVRAQVDAEVDVVLGRSAPFVDAVRQQAENMSRKVTLHVDAGRMHQLMGAADLAIGAGGTSAWERCCLGLPTLTLILADNQKLVTSALSEANAALPCDTDNLPRLLGDLWRDSQGLRRMGEAAARLCDGLGAPRSVLGLWPETARDGAPIGLRPATLEDAHLVWTWQQEPRTRQFARNPRPPALEEHRQWMRARLADPGSVFNLIMHGDRPAGVLRFDRLPDETDETYEVSILVAPDRYRLGLAGGALRMGRFLLPWARHLAWIRPENDASLTLFQRAGYRRLDHYRHTLEPE